MSNCSQVASLNGVVQTINSLPQVLPPVLLLSNTSNDSNQPAPLILTSVADAWVWGSVMMVVSVGLLLLLCLFYCCVCCCMCRKSEHQPYHQRTHKRSKICCALFTLTLIFSMIVLLCFSLWLETEVNKGLSLFTASDTNISNSGDADIITVFELYRYPAALTILSLALLVLLLSVFVFCCAPACKSSTPILLIMFVHVLLALLLSVYAGVTFALVVFGSRVCGGLYSSHLCEVKSLIGSFSANSFCNGVLVDMFTVMMLVAAVVLILYTLQVCAVVYARLICKSRYTEVETVGQSSEMFISTPLTVGGTRFHGGVWDAYGAQTVMGVKSRGQAIPSGYSPEAYPMGAVAPVAPVAPLSTDNYSDMKEVTLRMQEVDDSTSDLHIMDV